MNKIQKLRNGQLFLNECKNICMEVPSVGNIQDIKNRYINQILNFTDIIVSVPDFNLFRFKFMDSLCSNGTSVCNRELLGEKKLFGHMIHFLQDDYLFNQILMLDDYMELSRIVETFISEQEILPYHERLDQVKKKEIDEHKKKETILINNKDQIERRFNGINWKIDYSRKHVGAVEYIHLEKARKDYEETKILIEKNNQELEDILKKYERDSKKFENNMRKNDSVNSMKPFRDKIHSKLDGYIRTDDLTKVKEVLSLFIKVKALREFDNFCKKPGSSLRITQEHSLFIDIISGFIEHIKKYGYRLLHPETLETDYVNPLTFKGNKLVYS